MINKDKFLFHFIFGEFFKFGFTLKYQKNLKILFSVIIDIQNRISLLPKTIEIWTYLLQSEICCLFFISMSNN